MGADSKIQWCSHTFNPWRGCAKVSPGCEHCYAETMSKRYPRTLGIWGANGTRVVASESMWGEPLKWNKRGDANQQCYATHTSIDAPRPRVFCASLADVFEAWKGVIQNHIGQELCICHGCGAWMSFTQQECSQDCRSDRLPRKATLKDLRMRLMCLIDQTKNLDWLLLTKRPELVPFQMGDISNGNVLDFRHMPNVWIGTSVEDKQRKERIDRLRNVRASVRFLSVEPLLEDLGDLDFSGIDWVICGCESGPKRRPMETEWAERIAHQCQEAGVAFFMKQMEVDGKVSGDIDSFPPSLRVREFPSPEASR